MVGEKVGENNIIEGDANNRSNVYTSCINNANKNTYYGHICWYLLGTFGWSDHRQDQGVGKTSCAIYLFQAT